MSRTDKLLNFSFMRWSTNTEAPPPTSIIEESLLSPIERIYSNDVPGIFSLIITVAMRTEWPEFELTSIEGTTEILGKMILTEYLLPFEAVSVLLLSALIGAAMLSRRGDSWIVYHLI